jgi:hypothetical protein
MTLAARSSCYEMVSNTGSTTLVESVGEARSSSYTGVSPLSAIVWLRTIGCCEIGFNGLGATSSESVKNHESHSMTRCSHSGELIFTNCQL